MQQKEFMFQNNINAVQSFIRSLAWTVCFLLIAVILVAPLSVFSQEMFGSGWVLSAPALIFNFWISRIVSSMFFILPEWERIVILRLGKFQNISGPGFFIIPPFIYSVAATIDNRIETHQVEATATLTKDNVPTKVTAAVEMRVEDPRKAVVDVQNYRQSVIWLSTEALKNTIGSMDLKDLLAERDQIAQNLRAQIDDGASVYGIDIRAVRITDIDTPPSLVEELAAIARARRTAEAKQIEANAEILVAEKISEASRILSSSPNGIKLRELSVLVEMSKNSGSMFVVYPHGDRSGEEIANGLASGNNHKK